jgi:cation-transporting ATPase 13A2
MQDIYTRYAKGMNTPSEYQLSLLKYGHCNIEVPVKGIPELLIQEVLNPFYIF